MRQCRYEWLKLWRKSSIKTEQKTKQNSGEVPGRTKVVIGNTQHLPGSWEQCSVFNWVIIHVSDNCSQKDMGTRRYTGTFMWTAWRSLETLAVPEASSGRVRSPRKGVWSRQKGDTTWSLGALHQEFKKLCCLFTQIHYKPVHEQLIVLFLTMTKWPSTFHFWTRFTIPTSSVLETSLKSSIQKDRILASNAFQEMHPFCTNCKLTCAVIAKGKEFNARYLK